MELKKCPNCGNSILAVEKSCKYCGFSFEPQEENQSQPATSQPVVEPSADAPQRPPKTWLTESILVTIGCCIPFGIVGIVHASKVEAAYNKGDYAEAIRCSKQAAKWTKLGFWLGLVVGITYAIFTFAAELISQ
jgi:hypothetical protein